MTTVDQLVFYCRGSASREHGPLDVAVVLEDETGNLTGPTLVGNPRKMRAAEDLIKYNRSSQLAFELTCPRCGRNVRARYGSIVRVYLGTRPQRVQRMSLAGLESVLSVVRTPRR